MEVADTGRGLTSSAAAGYGAYVTGSGVTGSGISNSGITGTAGHGLPGMRERAAAAGGTIDVGPLPGGGFRVAARLPLARPPATAAATAPGPANSSAPQEANT